jgi:WD40 repeat protein/uncharacterized caspase-like protein
MQKLILFATLATICLNIHAQSPELILPTGHSLNIESVLFSPDNQYALTASWDKLAKLYEVSSGKEIRTFKGHRGYVNSAVFSPDGTKILTASWDSTARVFEMSTGELLFELNGHQGQVNTAVFSSNGEKILTASWDGSARVWNAKTGQLIHTLAGQYAPIQSAEFSPEGDRALFASLIGTIYQFDVNSGTELHRIQGHNKMINSIHYSPDGKKIVTSSMDSSAKIFDAKTGAELLKLKGHKNNVFCAVFSSKNDIDPIGGKYVLTGSWDGTAILFDAITGTKIQTFAGEKSYVAAASISPDGNWVACGYYDSKVRVFDTKTGKVKCLYTRHKAMISDVQFDKTNTLIMSAAFDNTVHVVKFQQNNTISILDGHTQYVANAAFNPRGDRFAVITSNALYVYASNTGRILEKFEGSAYFGKEMIYHPSGESIAVAKFDNTSVLVDAYTGELLHTYKGHKGYISDIQFSPDGKKLVTCSYDSTLRVFDAFSEKQLFVSNIHKGMLHSAKFSPDGKQLVTTCSDFKVRILDSGTGKLIREFDRMPEYLSGAEFSPVNEDDPKGGKYLLVMGYTNGFTLLDSQSGDQVNAYSTGTKFVVSAHFSPDGDRIIACHDHYVQQFDTKTAALIGSMTSHKNIVNDAVYNADGSYILTSGLDHLINLWDGKSTLPLWTMMHVNSTDQLIHDPHFRFDGTTGARDLLYFVCGMEVVELDQVKEALYIPNLVERIMSKENLENLPKLSTLEICGVAPLVDPVDKKDGGYHFKIAPRKGGLSGIEVYINGTLRETVPVSALKSTGGSFDYSVPSSLLEKYSTSASAKVKVIALPAKSSVHSRSVFTEQKQSEIVTEKKPSLHAVMIGIDDYQGDGLDLNFASKDANDLEKVLKKSAENFLNEDGSNRVHFYNLTLPKNASTETNNRFIPDRKTILSTFRTIVENCRPEDILLLFFAGHGELQDKKHLILLTSEASKEEAPNFSGIAFTELLTFLKEAPANKRVLILDACYSGAAINELGVSDMAGTRGVLHGEEASNLTKDLDELASKSGLAVLSASASDQKALELPQYEHGLLTYALLETFLHDPEVVNDKNLVQLEDWFRKTEKTVHRIKETQEAQRFVPTNYSIGLMDESVRSLLNLREIPTIWIENVMNDELKYDDLDLRAGLIVQLKDAGSRGSDNQLLLAEKRSEQAISVNVLYTTKGNNFSARIMFIKNKKLLAEFQFQHAQVDVSELSKLLVNEFEINVKKLKP